ncbi:MAG: hypothetical protein ACXVWW_06945, partial [Nocardioides sp.]
ESDLSYQSLTRTLLPALIANSASGAATAQQVQDHIKALSGIDETALSATDQALIAKATGDVGALGTLRNQLNGANTNLKTVQGQLPGMISKITAGIRDELTDGALQMDDGLVRLRGGASDLVAGLIKLHDGAGQLSAGLKSKAAPGAKQLSDGLQQLKSKTPELADGVHQIYAGQVALAAGLKKLYDGVQAMPEKVRKQVESDLSYQSLTRTLLPALIANSASGAATAQQVQDHIKALSGIDETALSATDQALIAKATGDIGALGTLRNQLNGANTNLKTVQGQLPGMISKITAGIRDELTAGIGVPAKGCNPTKTLRCGAAALADGGKQLNDAVPQLRSGVDQLAAGGLQLSDGLGAAADGAGQIDDGLGQARDGAPQIVDGAKQLSEKGSQKIAQAGQDTAQSYGEMYAELVAEGKRAREDSMAIGAPEGATAMTAYQFIVTGDDGQGSRNTDRALLAGGLLIATGGGLLLRRRFAR